MTGSKYICKCATGYKGESCESKSTFKKVVDAGKGLVDKGKQLLNTGKQVLDLVNDITGGDSDDSGGGLIDTIGSLVNKFTHNGNDEVYIDNERFKEEPDYPDYGDGDDDEDEDYPDYGDGDDDEDEDNNDDEDNEDYGDDGAQCPDENWKLYHDTCYYFGEGQTWEGAGEMCRLYDSILAEPTDPQAQKAVKHLSENNDIENVPSAVWIGMSYNIDEEEYVWASDGRPVNWDVWGNDVEWQPELVSETKTGLCVSNSPWLAPYHSAWELLGCSTNVMYYICQRELSEWMDDDDNDDDNADDGEVDDDEDEGDFRKRSLDVQESSELGKRSVPESGVKLSPPCGPGCIQGEHKAKLEKLYT